MNTIQLIVTAWIFFGIVAFLIERDQVDFDAINKEEFLGLVNPSFLKALMFALYIAMGAIRLIALTLLWILKKISNSLGG